MCAVFLAVVEIEVFGNNNVCLAWLAVSRSCTGDHHRSQMYNELC